MKINKPTKFYLPRFKIIKYNTNELSGFWVKRNYDQYGREIYVETSNGYWEKREYDDNGNEIYNENSLGIDIN